MSFGWGDLGGGVVVRDVFASAGAGAAVFVLVRHVDALGAVAGPGHALLPALAGALLAGLALALVRGRRLVHEVRGQRAAAAALRLAQEHAEVRARRYASLLASVSHEIRTPLTGIIGFATVLEQELPPDQREAAHIIRDSGERLVEMLNALLDLSRLEAGVVAVRPVLVDVSAEVEAAARLFRPAARAAGIALVVDVPPEGLPALLDGTFLHRILVNLLSNAVKFTGAGGVTVRARRAGDAVRLEVQDTGIGMSEAFLPHLFGAFVQEEPGLARTHEGSGLGLALTRHLVERMHGTITVESRKGEGSTFTVMLPRVPGVGSSGTTPLPEGQAFRNGQVAG